MNPSFSTYEPLLRRALSHASDGATIEDVKREIARGRALLWPGRASVAVTQVHVEKLMHVWLAAGDLGELVKMAEAAADLGRKAGCTLMTADDARPGWARVMLEHGWRERRVLVRDLQGG